MHYKLISSFSRTVGKTLSTTQKKYINNNLHNILIDEKYIQYINNINKKIWLEIGFGNGEHILSKAINNKDILFIGCEPFLNGIANLLINIDKYNIDNIMIWNNDARILLDQLNNNILDRIYILFPDPWPKIRHHKRRLISNETLSLINSKLKNDSKLIIATDHSEYASKIKKLLENSELFNNNIDDYHKQPDDWTITKYQQKALNNGDSIYYFDFYKTRNNL